MNLVVICGRLCADPILKEANGRKYVSVSIAVNRPKNQGGTQTADFIECVELKRWQSIVKKDID